MAFGQPDRPVPLDDDLSPFGNRPSRPNKNAAVARYVMGVRISGPVET
jgi:hypothetical protein